MSDTAHIQVNLYNGNRQPLPANTSCLIRIIDGNQRRLADKFFEGSSFDFAVPWNDTPIMDNYTVLATVDGLRDAGFFPVLVNPRQSQRVDLMLLPKQCECSFLSWMDLCAQHPKTARFLQLGSVAEAMEERYESLRRNNPLALASLLNLTCAMSTISLPALTPLDYFRSVLWDESLGPDRFFGYADKALVEEIRLAATHHEFAPEPNPGLFHPDATCSFKQIQFGEANVQLTFHERDTQRIGTTDCIRVEPDIDYYKDLGAHALFEVIPNAIGHGRTDPRTVYMLRWIAGRHAGVPEFDPAYTVVPTDSAISAKKITNPSLKKRER